MVDWRDTEAAAYDRSRAWNDYLVTFKNYDDLVAETIKRLHTLDGYHELSGEKTAAETVVQFSIWNEPTVPVAELGPDDVWNFNSPQRTADSLSSILYQWRNNFFKRSLNKIRGGGRYVKGTVIRKRIGIWTRWEDTDLVKLDQNGEEYVDARP